MAQAMFACPPANNDGEYAVERILDARIDAQGVVLHRVRWAGWPPAFDTWEPMLNLLNALDAVKAFWVELGMNVVFVE